MIGELYGTALAGGAHTHVEYADGVVTTLPVERWFTAQPGDEGILRRCVGPTLDVGCGPGRLVTELGAVGVLALGIDVTPTAVALTARAGGSVLLRDVFARVPGTGRWQTVVLADGNVGIGGDPEALLCRARGLLAPTGQVVVEVEAPGVRSRRLSARLRTPDVRSDWFPWAIVGTDALPALADRAGLAVTESWTEGTRWLATLTPRSATVTA